MTLRLTSALERTFEVVVARDLLSTPQLSAAAHISRALIITTPTVDKYYGERIKRWFRTAAMESDYAVLPLTEQGKNMQAVESVAALAIRHSLGRRDALVACGGGVCSDIVALSASMVRRGIAHVRIPTTLLGQVDAGIGIKGGVNCRNHKNYLGCFHPPSAVFVDPRVLRTLRKEHVLQGLAEIIKIALVADANLFEMIARYGNQLVETRFQEPRFIAEAVIRQSIALMLQQLQENPFEDRSLQRLVDMGHTFSPVLEAESGFTLAHGEAVAIDMALTCSLASRLGMMEASEAERVPELLRDLGLPIWSPLLDVGLCRRAIEHATAHRGGRLNLVIAPRIGCGEFLTTADGVDPSTLEASIAALHALATRDERQRAPRRSSGFVS